MWEKEAAQGEWGDYVKTTDHEQVVGQLRAEIEALVKDAGRYRWLVGVLRHDYHRWAAVVDHNQANVSAEDFGVAIDAAMAAMKEQAE